MEALMDNVLKCLRCGGTNVHTGTLHSTGRVHFRPSDAEFFKLKTANVDVLANMCLDCGSVGLVGDIEKTRKVTDGQ
jgi:hypothetical protein